MNHNFRAAAFLTVSTCLFAQSIAPKGSVAAKRPVDPIIVKQLPSSDPGAEAAPLTRLVQYGERDVVRVNAKVRYTTLLVLPKTEQILDFTCGDKEFWVINGTQNLAYLKPAKLGVSTNLNLITASGNIYSFVLTEVSEKANLQPDFKLFVELKEGQMLSAVSGAPRYVSSENLEDYRRQIDALKDEIRKLKESAQTTIDNGIATFLSNVRFPYHFEAGKKPFGVRAIYHDEKFTYIQARPEETPVVYELKDGKPNQVNVQYKDGVYIVQKILDEGYLAIGKKKLGFARQD